MGAEVQTSGVVFNSVGKCFSRCPTSLVVWGSDGLKWTVAQVVARLLDDGGDSRRLRCVRTMSGAASSAAQGGTHADAIVESVNLVAEENGTKPWRMMMMKWG